MEWKRNLETIGFVPVSFALSIFPFSVEEFLVDAPRSCRCTSNRRPLDGVRRQLCWWPPPHRIISPTISVFRLSFVGKQPVRVAVTCTRTGVPAFHTFVFQLSLSSLKQKWSLVFVCDYDLIPVPLYLWSLRFLYVEYMCIFCYRPLFLYCSQGEKLFCTSGNLFSPYFRRERSVICGGRGRWRSNIDAYIRSVAASVLVVTVLLISGSECVTKLLGEINCRIRKPNQQKSCG